MTRAVQLTRELARILELPRRADDAPPGFPDKVTALLRRPGGNQTLRPIQALALYELFKVGGLFAPLRVGAGKTLISFLAAMAVGARRPLLLLPAKLIGKTERELRALMQHWRIPNYIRIVSYESLGRVAQTHLLTLYKPDLIVGDEVHKLRHPKTAVTRRVKRYMDQYPATKFVALSGTITKRSLRDYHHIIRWCLKPLGMPLPNGYGELEDWADALDEHNRERVDVGALVAFTDDSNPALANVRQAYQRRLTATPGVIASAAGEMADCSLLLRHHWLPQGPAIEQAFAKLRHDWELPNGEELIDGMSVWRAARQLALGLYYRWDPAPPDEWRYPRKEWASTCRRILSGSRSLDSELAVIRAIEAGQHREARPVLESWRAVKQSFVPNPVPVWIDDAPLDWCTTWIQRHTAIAWTEHTAFAKALAQRSGLRYYGRQGVDEETGKTIEAHPTEWSCIASMRSNGEGRNLQAWSRSLVVSHDPQIELEQFLGRLHRPGQQADEVIFDFAFGCTESLADFWKHYTAAHYVQQTTGAEQKVLTCDLDIPPSRDDNRPQWVGSL